jgi:heme/copper-type cytochrome/quinol oxidase subunit 3
MHGLHAIAGLAALGMSALELRQGRLAPSSFVAIQIFWYFVVALWPVLYFMVYL